MTARPEILHSNSIDVRQLPDDVDLVAAIRHLGRDPDLGFPWSWSVQALDPGSPWYTQPGLIVGVRNADTGALAWDDHIPMVPAHGGNTAAVDYWLAGLDHTPMNAHTEIPLSDALAALSEFIRTGRRPTCVEWVAAAR